MNVQSVKVNSPFQDWVSFSCDMIDFIIASIRVLDATFAQDISQGLVWFFIVVDNSLDSQYLNNEKRKGDISDDMTTHNINQIEERQLNMGSSHNFKDIRSKAIDRRSEKVKYYLPIFSQILSANKITPEFIDKITRLDVPALVQYLNSGKITSEVLLAIYAERACTIGVINCIITEQYFDFALTKARECDKERQGSGKKNWTLNDEWDMERFLPPLFGIPTSIKDNINMQGTCSTIGITVRAERPFKQDCATIKCLKNTGQIPFIKTNLPQLAFNFDSFNFIWGRTLNPWNHKKSAGGSSGGEGAAIASRVSPIGIGNDMAGSIRIPAAFNGVCGLLPSADRIPFWGQITKYSTGFTGMDTVMCVNGPLSTSIDSLALWLKNMTVEEFYQGEHDAYKKLIPFDTKVYKEYAEGNKKPKIGYLQSLQLIEPTPAARRAVVETVAFFKKEGYEVVQVSIPNEAELIYSLYTELLGQGDFASFNSALEGQPLIDEYSQLGFLANRCSCLQSLFECLISKKSARLGGSIKALKRRSVNEYVNNVGRIHEMQQDFIKYWRAQKLDFMILPGFASQATNHGSSKDGSFLATYTYIFNILRMCVTSLPVTTTKENELHYESDYEDQVTELIRNNIKDAAGMPISIQVVGMPFHEERVLGISKKIEKHYRFYEKNPLPAKP